MEESPDVDPYTKKGQLRHRLRSTYDSPSLLGKGAYGGWGEVERPGGRVGLDWIGSEGSGYGMEECPARRSLHQRREGEVIG